MTKPATPAGGPTEPPLADGIVTAWLDLSGLSREENAAACRAADIAKSQGRIPYGTPRLRMNKPTFTWTVEVDAAAPTRPLVAAVRGEVVGPPAYHESEPAPPTDARIQDACRRLRDISGKPNDGPKDLADYISDVAAGLAESRAECERLRPLADAGPDIAACHYAAEAEVVALRDRVQVLTGALQQCSALAEIIASFETDDESNAMESCRAIVESVRRALATSEGGEP